MAFQKELSLVYQSAPVKNWDDVDKVFGDKFYYLNGAYAERGGKVSRHAKDNGWLPAVLDSNKVVVGDLIPSTSWGASLSNMLTKKSWDELRLPLIEQNHNVCELCGSRYGSLDVHEMWNYEYPPAEEMKYRRTHSVFGVQHLMGLMTLCKSCHECFHLGFANVQGRLKPVLERLRLLNGWSTMMIDQYSETVNARFERASEIGWFLDFSRIRHPSGGLTVKSPWKLMSGSQLLTSKNAYGGDDNLTVLLNTPWKFAKEPEWRPSLSIGDLKL